MFFLSPALLCCQPKRSVCFFSVRFISVAYKRTVGNNGSKNWKGREGSNTRQHASGTKEGGGDFIYALPPVMESYKAHTGTTFIRPL